jgi:predicted ThiF/HesA family dinucleotide-utilizing enzyme
LNQIIDNKEAGKIGIHTFTNASSFTVGESDVKIISIEFATSEEVMVLLRK